MQNVDSAEVVHGLFTMKGSVDTVAMGMLYMDEESIMPLVLEGGNMKISITNSELRVSGTPLNDKLYTFFDKKNSLDMKVEELKRREAKMIMNGEDPVHIHQQLVREGELLSGEINDFVKGFIEENSNNVLGPGVFVMLFPYPVMTPQIEEIVKSAPVEFRNNKLVKQYISKARENLELLKDKRPDATLPPSY